MPGTLFVVATPIGNLEDLTFRALRVLKECDVVAAEDTRRTARLLAHYEISKPLVSLREHNERHEAARLVVRMTDGESVALVTDAGTPGISDPGAWLVRSTREAGLAVVPIPGPSAVTAALSVAGFDAATFTFLGFPPARPAERAAWFQDLAQERRLVVFFEAPHRIADTIGHLAELSPARQACVCGELTKLHERTAVRMTSELRKEDFRPQGEFVLVLGAREDSAETDDRRRTALDLFGQLTSTQPVPHESAVEMTAHLLGLRPSFVSNVVRRHAISVKQQNKAAP